MTTPTTHFHCDGPSGGSLVTSDWYVADRMRIQGWTVRTFPETPAESPESDETPPEAPSGPFERSRDLLAALRTIASRGRMDDADVQILFDCVDEIERFRQESE